MRRYVEILRQQRHPAKFLASRLLMKTGACSKIVMQRSGYRLRFHPTALSSTIWINRREKEAEEAFLQRCVTAGDTAIDVGANIGTIALALANAVAPGGRVLAIEPHPKIFAFLLDNLALNAEAHVIEPVNAALGSNSGRVSFSDMSDDSQNHLMAPGKGEMEVVMEPLDKLAPEGPIALLKLDVEGYEPEVLQGAPITLGRTEMLYLECIPSLLSRFGWSETRLCELIRDAGFEVFVKQGERLVPNEVESHPKKMLACLRNPRGFAARTSIPVG